MSFLLSFVSGHPGNLIKADISFFCHSQPLWIWVLNCNSLDNNFFNPVASKGLGGLTVSIERDN